MEHVHCSLCGADEPQPWLTLSDRFSGQTFSLSRCDRCGLIYSADRPSMDELPDYYPQDYEAYQQPETEMSSSQVWHSNRMWEMQVDYIEKFKPSRGQLLDVGCATGEFLNIARKRGWQVHGLELIEQTAQIARQRHGIQVDTGRLETVNLPENTFDLITMWDVLEHLPDPLASLQHCCRLLRESGVIVFSIPNLASVDRYLFGRSWIGWDAPRHFTLFTLETLQAAFKKTGYKMVDRRCFLGGKGTFLLSLDIVLASRPGAKFVKAMYPVISGLLWPYRQVSYLLYRGPILAVAACKQG